MEALEAPMETSGCRMELLEGPMEALEGPMELLEGLVELLAEPMATLSAVRRVLSAEFYPTLWACPPPSLTASAMASRMPRGSAFPLPARSYAVP
jgi:hypothetical protein